MKLKQLMDFEMDKDKKSSLQVKAIKALAGFLILMFLLTILSRAADSLTIAKVTASAATGGVISHNIETDGNITPNKDIAISTSADIKIASVEATEGKTVKKGDVLIQLDMDDLKTKLLKAQKDLAVAQATASDKKANEAIEADNKARSLERSYEDYNQTISDADDAVSKAKDNMSEAWKAYNDYKKNNNNNSDDTDTTVSDSLQKTVEEKQEAYDKAVDELDGVEKHIEYDVCEEIKKARVDKSQACVCLQMILRHAGSCWEALSSENEDLFHKREILMGKVTEQKTFKEAFKMAEDYVHEVFERRSSLNSSSGQKQAVLAMEYIRQHYNEPELGLNDICSYLNIGTSYFSTIFKEATGGTFLEFLSKTRMEKAKELLEQTALKNYEIAEKVGFSDPHYFGISFKKMTGKTPTEYAREKRSI